MILKDIDYDMAVVVLKSGSKEVTSETVVGYCLAANLRRFAEGDIAEVAVPPFKACVQKFLRDWEAEKAAK